ncbi:MAG: OsmC family protein [Saprospiraceae bacterium]|nr:OsmC family protein [Saprospiraceae bacterium]
MKIKLERVNDAVHFRATNPDGLTIDIDGSAEVGGENLGMRPMQAFLSAMVSCSSIDIVTILKKMRQEVTNFRVDVEGLRVDEHPKVFHTIHLHFFIGGQVKEERAHRAIELSLTKYCSVSMMLKESVKVDYTLTLEP